MISVVICTYNRSESLRRTLKSLREMPIPPELSWELIVVDNNSSDGTRKVVEAFGRASGLNVRYVFEDQQGLSHARNRGIREAKGEILSFIDDDVVVSKDWLVEIKKAFSEYNTVCVGGRILLKEDLYKPDWWDGRYNDALGRFDQGDSVTFVGENCTRIVGIGANMSFKRSVFDKYGFFRTNLGRIGNRLLMGEETEFYKRLRLNGEPCIYYPNAVVYQCPTAERLTKQYLKRWYFRMGEWYFLEEAPSETKIIKIFGVPRWKYRSAMGNFFKAFLLFLLGRNKEAFYNELEFIVFMGYLFGSVKKRISNT